MEFVKRAWPAMNQHQRARILARAAPMDEMNAEPIDLRPEVIEAVEFAFLRAPVIARPPVLNQLLHV